MKVELTSSNFIKQITMYGFFAEQIPDCFSSQSFAADINELNELIKGKAPPKGLKSTNPMTLSTYKSDLSRRVLSVPNPEAFLYLVSLMADNWNQLLEFSKSENSLSPITYISSYDDTEIECLNSENLREHFREKSDYIEGIKNCIRVALGYKYCLKVDISNCYNSIYTHSIAWAICGKAEAKKYHVKEEPKTLKPIYELADKLDKRTRALKNNETNGIVVGPFTSRIFSEIILARIDKNLYQKGFCFRRYVDDYKFYFRTEAQAQESLSVIEKVLNEYNLNLNTAKTEITKFPFEVISQMQNTYETAFEKDGVFGILNAASILHQSGEKGAYKYALKLLRGKDIPVKDFDLILPLLVNIMLVDPKYGKYVVQYLKRNIKQIDKEKVYTIINSELKTSLENELQQEALLFMYFIKELKLEIQGSNLLNALKSKNDFVVLIALDIWKHRNKTVKRTASVARVINSEIENLFYEVSGEKYTGEHWMLLYEAEMHSLCPMKEYEYPEKSVFFQKMKEKSITFYNSVRFGK